jgi:putative cell wall-binding protein
LWVIVFLELHSVEEECEEVEEEIEEAEVDYREELMCTIEVIRREKKKNKKLQVELDKKKDTRELEQMITKLKVQIEEDKRRSTQRTTRRKGQDHWKLGSRGCHTKKGYSKEKYAE